MKETNVFQAPPEFETEELAASKWQHIFKIFMYVILSKKRIYQEEMAMFAFMTKRVKSILSPNLILTDMMLKDWFMLNREEVMQRVLIGQEERAVQFHMDHLDEVEDKLTIIRAMQSIAKCDGDLQSDERRLITYVAQQWRYAA